MTAGRVVVVGAVNVDLVLRVVLLPSPGETVASEDLVILGGGKAANTAAAAARLAPTALVAAVGDDDFGTAALADLQALGVDTSGVRRAEGVPTGVAAVVTSSDDNQIVIAPGANGRLRPEDVTRAFASLALDDACCCVVSTEVDIATSSTAARAAAAAGATVMVNPSPVAAFDGAVLECGPILVLNQHEVVRLADGSEPMKSAEALSARTGRPVVVTLGAAGAVVVDAGRRTDVAAVVADVVDTTGAGDAFTGTLAASLVRGASLVEATQAAVAAAADCVAALGARGWLLPPSP